MAQPTTHGVPFFPARMFPARYWPLRMFPAAGPATPAGVSRAAIPLATWAGSGDIALLPGVSPEALDMLALVPVDEPLSAGPPPVAPALVRRLTVGWPVRSVLSRAGYRVTSASGTAARARFMVRWGAITQSELEQLRVFFRDEVIVDGVGGVGGGRFGFELQPDGPAGTTVIVRPVAGVELSWLARAWGGGGGAEEVIEFEVEELFTPTGEDE